MTMLNSTQNLLKQYENEVKKVSNIHSDTISTNEDTLSKIDNINETIIQREEKQKLLLRDKLTNTVSKFIWIQLIFFNLIVLIIVLSVTTDIQCFKTIHYNSATVLFNFLKYYISATIVELLGMLVFILHYVFSKYGGIKKIKMNNKCNKEQDS